MCVRKLNFRHENVYTEHKNFHIKSCVVTAPEREGGGGGCRRGASLSVPVGTEDS